MKDIKMILFLITYMVMVLALSIILQILGNLQVFGIYIYVFYASSIAAYLSWKVIELIRSVELDE